MEKLDHLLKNLWENYQQINRQAQAIHRLLTQRGEKVVNDHIAFRTFNLADIGLQSMARVFCELGYQPKGEYEFPDKHLYARHYEHPRADLPKIFISEIKLEALSHSTRNLIHELTIQIPTELEDRQDFCYSGRPWDPINSTVYEKIKQESEYAAWLTVFGFRPNHFTVLVNSLKTFASLQELNTFLKDKGFPLNAAGGEVKGSPQQYLEQSSTTADPVEIDFVDGHKKIPGCYYEFAKRYPMPDGKLFNGFIEKSANKIFESTDNR
jgi:hypothetical protein